MANRVLFVASGGPSSCGRESHIRIDFLSKSVHRTGGGWSLTRSFFAAVLVPVPGSHRPRLGFSEALEAYLTDRGGVG